jgi:hypothetical protein
VVLCVDRALYIHIAAAIVGAVLSASAIFAYALTAFSDPGYQARRDHLPDIAAVVRDERDKLMEAGVDRALCGAFSPGPAVWLKGLSGSMALLPRVAQWPYCRASSFVAGLTEHDVVLGGGCATSSNWQLLLLLLLPLQHLLLLLRLLLLLLPVAMGMGVCVATQPPR